MSMPSVMRSARASPTRCEAVWEALVVEFSWWVWSVLFAVAVAAVAMLLRSAVLAVRADGFGRGRLHRGAAAPWFWGAIAVAVTDGVLLFGWAYLLDR